MKKILLFSVITVLLLFCACSVNEVTEIPENVLSEKVSVTVARKNYEIFVPEKTRIEVGIDGDVIIHTPSVYEAPQVVDLEGLSGCEYIKKLTIYVNGEAEKVYVPNLPNLESFYIYGLDIKDFDISKNEGIKNAELWFKAENVNIGKGPEHIILDYYFDISKISGAENVKSILLHAEPDLSLLSNVGEIEKVYIVCGAENISAMENLKSLKRLYLNGYDFDFDLSEIEKLSLETLVLERDINQNSIDSFGSSETITELHINDYNLSDISFIKRIPNLKTILLSVGSLQDESVVFMEVIDEEILSVLNTNVDKAPLEEFIKNGGELYLIFDWTR